MGQSTDASICYGIPFDEGTEFPWDDYDDFDDWYLYEVLGYKPSIKLYDDDGEYINGVRPAQNLIDKVYDEKEVFIENNPKCPVELITHCHHEYPMYIIALRDTEQTANRGTVEEVNPLITHNPNIITEFLQKYNIEYTQEPKWLLYSYWG